MKTKTILAFLILFLIISLVYAYSAENVVKFSEGKNHEEYKLKENEKLYIRFNAATTFNRFDIYFISKQTGGETNILLYNWDNSIPPTNKPIESFKISQINENAYTTFNFEEKNAGEYVICIEQLKKEITLRKYNNKRSKVDLFRNDFIETGSIDVNLYYTNKPGKELNELSEYELPKQTPIPEPKDKPNAFADNIRPDTWTAVDGLGRTLPLYNSLSQKDKDKIVGIFYWTWHGELSKSSEARNLTEIIKQHPEATNDFKHKVWEGYAGYHHWNEPLFGYYSTCDEYVLRKHAEMLADAGVDFIAFDCTNGSYTWTESYMTLLKVFTEAKKDGVKVPKITFMSNFAAIDSTWQLVKQLYTELYKPGLYNDLWFYLDGKPLMWAFPQAVPQDGAIGDEIHEFFTFRYPYAEGISPFDDKYSWGWSGNYPNKGYGKGKNGHYEQMSLSIAINAHGPMNNPNAWGRAYSHSGYSSSYTYGGKKIVVNNKMENAVRYGIFIQEQWDYVIKKDPDIIFVCGWNEWVAIRHEEWGGYENAFPDQFIDEYSRDIEPSKGDLKDYYYYQLVANIRKFKGVSKPISHKEKNTIDIHGDFSQWEKVKAIYNHYTNNTKKRDHAGYIGTYYESDTMRNDIRTAKIAFDESNIYFYVETVDNLTPSTDKAWMRLFIDTDARGEEPNWEGFEYVVNRVNPGEKCYVEKSKDGWNWEKVYEADYSVKDNILQIVIPREIISQQDGVPSFSFKWTDNNCEDGDILTLYTDGDSAPGGRFCFAYNIGNKNDNNILKYTIVILLTIFLIKMIILKKKYS